jgi:toxin ParE1/3/4
MKLDITRAARADLLEIADYSRKTWGQARTRLYLDDLRETLHRLARAEIGGVSDEQVGPGLRRQLAGSHAVWFRVEDGRLRIIRILHHSRDAARHLGGGEWPRYFRSLALTSVVICSGVSMTLSVRSWPFETTDRAMTDPLPVGALW